MENKDLFDENRELRERLDALQEAYNRKCSDYESLNILYCNIISSGFWRITTPLRRCCDKGKVVLALLSPSRREIFNSRKNRISVVRRKKEEHTSFSKKVRFSVVTPLFNTPPVFLKEMIESVQAQTYKNWELCLADGSDESHSYVGEYVLDTAKKDPRIKYVKLDKNLGISENTNKAIELATGDYIALFDHDDVLYPSALFCYAQEIEKGADFIYCDEDKFETLGNGFFMPHYKPDFSPDLLRSNNYICHFTVFDRNLIEKCGLFRSEFDGSQDHDIILRLTEQANKIVHIPEILYHWRVSAASVASDPNAKPYTAKAGIKAVNEHLKRMNINGKAESLPIHPNIYRIRYEIKDTPLISILIPSCNHVKDLDKCIRSIENLSTYKNYEIIVIENNSDSATFDYYKTLERYGNVKVVVYETDTFNYSAINNYGAQFAKGDYLLLLNNDTEVITPSWMEELLMLAQRDDVGAVGAKLFYPDDTVQHAGVILGHGGIAGHSFLHEHRTSAGYFARCAVQQNLTAVTAACVMLSKKVWDEISGLNEDFAVAFNDIDMCMRIREAGYLVCFTPFAELYHYESKSRGLDTDPVKAKRFEGEIELFKKHWQKALDGGDPYYNKNLSLFGQSFTVKSPAEIKSDKKKAGQK